jgi:Fe2+ or Zn2+ uptake regulation protein
VSTPLPPNQATVLDALTEQTDPATAYDLDNVIRPRLGAGIVRIALTALTRRGLTVKVETGLTGPRYAAVTEETRP